MVRLVFRPFTQIWRSICTSEPLRASTRVSPGFTLPKQSSPSLKNRERREEDVSLWCSSRYKRLLRLFFLSQYYSYLSGPNMYAHTQTFLANDCGRRIVQNSYHCYFHYAWRFATSILAHMLDSLVRVSRRGKENHFASITSTSD